MFLFVLGGSVRVQEGSGGSGGLAGSGRVMENPKKSKRLQEDLEGSGDLEGSLSILEDPKGFVRVQKGPKSIHILPPRHLRTL